MRKLDIQTGEFSNILVYMQDNDRNLLDFPGAKVEDNQGTSVTKNNVNTTLISQPALGSSVAAIAYDRKNNRLFYTPVNIDQLYFIDLNTIKAYPVSDQFFSKAGKYDIRNTGPISRMVIAPDDFGYTITNDGNHLIRFTTNGAPILTDLGDLVDDPQNNEMTIHSFCANSGGDMIADDAGHLFLITGSNKVFKIDIGTRVASYLATVSGLPPKFSTSGVAVSENGRQLLVTSSVYTDAYFMVDPEIWKASSSQTKFDIFESADLANSNVLSTKVPGNSNIFISKSQESPGRIRIFPNPVMEDEFSVQFNELPPGSYTILMANSLGRKVIQQRVTVTGQSLTEVVHVPGDAVQGFYYIRLLDEKKNVVGTEKLVLERW